MSGIDTFGNLVEGIDFLMVVADCGFDSIFNLFLLVVLGHMDLLFVLV